jgi:hypothetical protein
MRKFIIKAAPDYLPLSPREFVRHFANLLTRDKFSLRINYDNYTKLIGYSCRALFEICLMHYYKEDLVIATTPLHHTSFRNIIERFVKPENIHIIELNENYNEITQVPEIKNCDLVVITHLFGQDMDLSILTEFKEKHNCLIIEDRVQGGSLDVKFSNENVDIAIYSMAMDKRPIALGGGFMYINNKHEKLIDDLNKIIENLPQEKTSSRFKELLKKIPTYLLYNSRAFLFSFLSTVNLLNIFNKKINILNISKGYRKSNPGFSHFGYMLKPSQGLLKSMYENFHKHKEVEQVYTRKYKFFIKCLTPKIVSIFFPWYKGNSSITPYNTILIDENLVDKFLEFLSKYTISSLPNPTYKLFNISYKNDSKDKKFNNGIAYIPSIANMSKREIVFLTDRVKEFYIKYQSKRKRK